MSKEQAEEQMRTSLTEHNGEIIQQKRVALITGITGQVDAVFLFQYVLYFSSSIVLRTVHI